MRLSFPKTLRWQFALSLVAMAVLVIAGGATAVRALLALSSEAQGLAREQLAYMQDAQELLDHSRQIQLYAAQGLHSAPAGRAGMQYEAIMQRLDEFDRLTARLAVSNDTSVLDLHQSSQLFRSSAQVVAQLQELPAPTGDTGATGMLQRSAAEMQEHAAHLTAAAQRQSEIFSMAYQASADRLADVSQRTALWAAGLLLGSLAAAWGIAHYFLGVHVLARLRVVSNALRDMGNEHDESPVALRVEGEDEIAGMARAVEQGIRDRRQLARARIRLEESRERLAAVLENSADAIMVLQEDRFVQVNRAAQRLLGAERLDLVGLSALPFVVDCDLGGSSVVGTTIDAKARRVDGTEVEVEIARSEVASVDRRLTILVARDATLRKEAERHLREARDTAEAARAAQAAFLAATSHELRTPLNAILGYAQLLQQSGRLAEPQHRQVQIIERSGQHLLALINDILDIAKHEAGKVELSLDKVRMSELVRVVGDIVRVKAQERGLQFSCSIEPDVPELICGDERRLKQVLLNLLGNAVKFTERGGVTLAISTLASGHDSVRLRFEVQDTGVGLSPQQCETLFRPFEQFGDRQRRAAGTGLGLAISRQLVRLMDSEILVKSEPGQGTRFWFDVDLGIAAPVERHTEAAKPVVGYRGMRRRVLVVDDDAFNRMLLSEMLTPLGFIVEQAADGVQALACARAATPDIVITDRVMPSMSGTELVQALQADGTLRSVPVIVVSASVDSVNGRDVGRGADVFLPKPLDRQALLDQIARLLHLTWQHSTAPVGPDG